MQEKDEALETMKCRNLLFLCAGRVTPTLYYRCHRWDATDAQVAAGFRKRVPLFLVVKSRCDFGTCTFSANTFFIAHVLQLSFMKKKKTCNSPP